jgi:hypothetical protein
MHSTDPVESSEGWWISTIYFLSLLNLNVDGPLKIVPLGGLVFSLIAGAIWKSLEIQFIDFVIVSITVLFIGMKVINGGAHYVNQTSFESFTPLLLLLLPASRQLGMRGKREVEGLLGLQAGIFFLDALIRLKQNGVSSFLDPELRFYAKIDGLYNNSNIAGQSASILFAYALSQRLRLRYAGIMLIAAVLSMSRTAWIACLVGFLLSQLNIKSIRKGQIALSFCIVLPLLIFYSNTIIDGITNDYSFQTKVQFISSFAEQILELKPQVVFLGGPLNSDYAEGLIDVEGYSPHNPFLKVGIYYGISGLFLYLLFYYYCIGNGLALATFACLIIQAFSGMPIIAPAIIFILSNHVLRRDNINTNPGVQRRSLYNTSTAIHSDPDV